MRRNDACLQVMPYSTGCATPLSNFEANLNYKDIRSVVLGDGTGAARAGERMPRDVLSPARCAR